MLSNNLSKTYLCGGYLRLSKEDDDIAKSETLQITHKLFCTNIYIMHIQISCIINVCSEYAHSHYKSFYHVLSSYHYCFSS